MGKKWMRESEERKREDGEERLGRERRLVIGYSKV